MGCGAVPRELRRLDYSEGGSGSLRAFQIDATFKLGESVTLP